MLILELAEIYDEPVTPLMVKKDQDARDELTSLNMARMVEPAELEIGVNDYGHSAGNILSF